MLHSVQAGSQNWAEGMGGAAGSAVDTKVCFSTNTHRYSQRRGVRASQTNPAQPYADSHLPVAVRWKGAMAGDGEMGCSGTEFSPAADGWLLHEESRLPSWFLG